MNNDGIKKVVVNIIRQDRYMLEMAIKNEQSVLESVKEDQRGER